MCNTLGYNCNNTVDPNGELIDAAESGNLTQAMFLVGCHGIDVNHIDEETGATALLRACERNDTELLKMLMKQGNIDPNIQSTKRGITPLHVASRLGNEEMVKELLKHPDIELNNGRYIDGATPLIIAAFHGHTKILKELMDTMAVNVNQARRDGWNALMIASKEGHSPIVAELLKNNEMNVRKEPRNGGCALYEASKSGNVEAVKSLLFHPEIEVNQVYNDVARRTELTSLQIAYERKHFDVVNVLLKCPKTDISRRDRKNEAIHDKVRKTNSTENSKIKDLLELLEANAILEHSCCSEQVNEKLVNATRYGDMERVKIFSQCHEFDINEGHNGMTPLHIAAREGYNDLVGFFLENVMIEVNKNDEIGNQVSALFYACQHGHADIVKQLVEYPKIDLNIQRAKDGATPLHVVTEQGDEDILELLLLVENLNTTRHRLDIDVNMGQDEGRTALMLASSAGQLRIMEMLLDHPNIDVNQLTNFDRVTALYIACSNKQSRAVIHLLKEPRTDVNKGISSPLGASVGQRLTNMVKDILLCPKTNITKATLHGIPVIKYAVQHGFSRIASFLQNSDSLLAGTKTCCLDLDKQILRSAYIGHVVMLQELMKCPNSDINNQGGSRNALYIASELGHSNYVKTIINYTQIDINRRNTYYGKTALFVAAEKNKLEVVKVLVNDSDISLNKGRSSDGATAFSMASEKGFFKIMMVLIPHGETDVNVGWSRVDWTFQTRNDQTELNDATEAPTITGGEKWIVYSCD